MAPGNFLRYSFDRGIMEQFCYILSVFDGRHLAEVTEGGSSGLDSE